VPPHQLPELADELSIATAGQVGVDPRLEGLQARLLEPRAHREQKRLAGEICERLAAPDLERGAQYARGVLGPPLCQ
jgi:hypothetical protein